MAEKTKADLYLAYLDQILAGENDIGLVDDVEIKELLLLAKTLMDTDLSMDSNLRENLRKQLLAQQLNDNKLNFTVSLSDDGELDEDTLDYVVAAGFPEQAGEQKDSCPSCGSRLQKLDGKCPFCNY